MRFIRDIIEERKRGGVPTGTRMVGSEIPVSDRASPEEPAPLPPEDRHAAPQSNATQEFGDDPGAGVDKEESFELFGEYGGEDDEAISADSLFASETGPESVSAPEVEADITPEPVVADPPAMMAPAPPVATQGETAREMSPRAPADTPFGAFDATEQILSRRPSHIGDDAGANPVQVPAPAEGRTSRRAARAKTRLLGFSPAQGDDADPFAADAASSDAPSRFPVGWLTVTGGRGRGAGFTLHSGVSNIGRGEDQTVRLDFGDNSISRSGHAIVAYDPEQRKFFLGHGGKANLVRLNDRPVLCTELMQSGDRIRIGETTLMFTALCGGDFDWSDDAGAPGSHSDGFDHAAAG